MTKVKLLLLLLSVVWVFTASEVSYGAHHTAIIIDADNGNVLHEVDATQSWYPASLTKLMTLYMTFDALKAGRIQLYDRLMASSHAAQQPNSKLGLRRGESLTVEEAILALITRSANDASVVLAEHLGGTEKNFAANMTVKAHSLGMYNTNFMNATGLPHDLQVTTSRDMAILAWNAQRNFPEYYHYFSAHSFNYKGRQLRAINKFTANYPGAEGMKTGFTCGSGFNLIGAAHQNGRHLIGVVMGGMTSNERYQLMMQKMDASFANEFGDGPVKNINTMTTHSAGSPPYQLDCGSHSSTNAVVRHHGSKHKAGVKHFNRARTSSKSVRNSSRKRFHLAKNTSRHPVKSKSSSRVRSTIKGTSPNRTYRKASSAPKSHTRIASKS
ncbi:MAG: D-alanyl-D-alanine carboxypeptidase family protein [Methylobacter sp.]|jgi:D-alanyl-D-alanine carboxypeptidase